MASQPVKEGRVKNLDPSDVIAFALFLIFPAILPFVRKAGPPILIATGLFAAVILWRDARLGKALKSHLSNSAILLFAAFLAWATISLAWSPWPSRGVHSIVNVVLLFASILMISEFPLSKNAPRLLAIGLSCGSVFIALDLTMGQRILHLVHALHDDIGFKYNMVAVTYVILAAALLRHQEGLKLLKLLFVGLFLAVAIFLSKSETAKLAILILFLSYLCASIRPGAFPKPLILGSLGFVWLFGAFAMPKLGLLQSFVPAEFWAAGSAPQRIALWTAFTDFAVHGLPWGWGIDSAALPDSTQFFASASPETRDQLKNWHSHNNILQIAVELGLPGLLLSFLSGARLISNSLNKMEGSSAAFLSFLAVIILIGCISHGLWQSWWWAAILIGAYFLNSKILSHTSTRPLDANSRKDRLYELISSEFFQAGLVVCCAALVAKLMRVSGLGPYESADLWVQSLFWSFSAVFMGSRFMKFVMNSSTPAAFGYVIPVVSLSFLIAVVIIFLARLDYQRLEMLLSFLLALPVLTAACFLEERHRQWRFHAFPDDEFGGDAYPKNFSLSIIDYSEPLNNKASDGIIVDFKNELSSEKKRYLAFCALNGVKAFGKLEISELFEGKIPAQHVEQVIKTTTHDLGFYHELKKAVDIGVALILAPCFLVIIAVCAIAIKLDDGGPIFFRQTRIGLKGKMFRVWKLRTMREQVDLYEARHFTVVDDDRITRVGRVLRRTRLDEFPQIINILFCEMSWIGPRPEAAPLAHWYASEIDLYHFRHIVRPGITGWAAVKQGNVAEVEAARQKLYYDFFYIKNYSFQLDLLIAMRTVKIMISGFGAK